MSKLPDFIIIGAGKCGTTSLFNYLKQHPQLYICPKKETFFFINEKSRANLTPWGAVTTLEEYLSLFSDAPTDSVIGEISTNYYAYPESAQLIYDLIPHVKILAILRDPAERAFSNYQMFVFEGNEKKDFSQLINKDNEFVKRGFYYAELIQFFKIFPQEQIKILLYEDFCNDSIKFSQEIFKFIEVDDTFTPDVSKKSRVGAMPKNTAFNDLLTKDNPLRKSAAAILKLFLPLEVRQKLRSNLIKKNAEKGKLSPENRKKLIEIYRSDILELQKLIKKDLSAWLK